jgi:hypothetical protein
VEASDIVQTVMDTGDSSYTNCEEERPGSDDGVRKKMDRRSSLSFPTKSTTRNMSSRGSRGNHDQHINSACKDGQKLTARFPQLHETCSGKRVNKIFLPFTFLMRVSIALCQTE